MERKQSTWKHIEYTSIPVYFGSSSSSSSSSSRGCKVKVGDLLDVLSEWCEWRLRQCYAIDHDRGRVYVGEPFKTSLHHTPDAAEINSGGGNGEKRGKEQGEWVSISSHRVAAPFQVPNLWCDEESKYMVDYPLSRRLADPWYQAVDFIRALEVGGIVDAVLPSCGHWRLGRVVNIRHKKSVRVQWPHDCHWYMSVEDKESEPQAYPPIEFVDIDFGTHHGGCHRIAWTECRIAPPCTITSVVSCSCRKIRVSPDEEWLVEGERVKVDELSAYSNTSPGFHSRLNLERSVLYVGESSHPITSTMSCVITIQPSQSIYPPRLQYALCYKAEKLLVLHENNQLTRLSSRRLWSECSVRRPLKELLVLFAPLPMARLWEAQEEIHDEGISLFPPDHWRGWLQQCQCTSDVYMPPVLWDMVMQYVATPIQMGSFVEMRALFNLPSRFGRVVGWSRTAHLLHLEIFSGQQTSRTFVANVFNHSRYVRLHPPHVDDDYCPRVEYDRYIRDQALYQQRTLLSKLLYEKPEDSKDDYNDCDDDETPLPKTKPTPPCALLSRIRCSLFLCPPLGGFVLPPRTRASFEPLPSLHSTDYNLYYPSPFISLSLDPCLFNRPP